MVIRKRWLAIGMVMIAFFALAACNNDQEDDDSSADGGEPQQTFTLGEALEKYPVWMETEKGLSEDSAIEGIYLFEDGSVKKYNTENLTLGIEEIMDITDDQLLDLVRKQGEKDDSFLDGAYTLDRISDESGQNIERINLNVEGEQQKEVTFQGDNLNQNIEDTNFTGFQINNTNALFTRANYADSPVELTLGE